MRCVCNIASPAAFVAQNSFVASMAARFAIEEGLLGAEDVYSDFDESEMEHVQEHGELEQTYGHYIPDEVLQRWEQRRKRKETELEVLGNAKKRRRRQELIRSKKESEKAFDALLGLCNNGPLMPNPFRTGMLQCLE